MNLWSRLREGLTRTRERIGGQVGGLLGLTTAPDEATLARLEEALLAADVGPAATDRLLERARVRMGHEPGLDLRGALERSAADVLGATRSRFAPDGEAPWVALLVGVNGVGKTTLAGKLAARFARDGLATMLVAADTFRAPPPSSSRCGRAAPGWTWYGPRRGPTPPPWPTTG